MKIIYLYQFIIILCEVGKTGRWKDDQASDRFFLTWVFVMRGEAGGWLGGYSYLLTDRRGAEWAQCLRKTIIYYQIGLSSIGAYRSR